MAMKRDAGGIGYLILMLLSACSDRHNGSEGASGTGGTATTSGMSSGGRAGASGTATGGHGGMAPTAGSPVIAGAGNFAGGSGGSKQNRCGIDMVLTHRILEDPAQWGGPQIFPESVWQTDNGIHVLWYGSQLRPDLDDGARLWLHVTTFDPDDGSLVQSRPIDVLPPESTLNRSGFTSAAGAPDGTFLATYLFWPQIGPITTFRAWAYLGHLAEPESGQRIVLFESDQPVPAIYFSGWDGDAFAIHAQDFDRSVNKNDALVGRLDTAGKLVTEFTRYTAGATAGNGILGYKISTEPTSGRSFLFDAPSAYRALTGHERDGSRISWIPESGWVNVKVPIFETDGGSAPMVRTDPEGGVWMAWVQGESRYAHYSASGELDAYGRFPWATVQTFLPRGGPRAELYASNSDFHLYRYDIDGMNISEPTVVVDSPCKANGCNPFWLGAFERNGETWLWFDEPHPDVIQLLRIVKVVPGCTYGPAKL